LSDESIINQSTQQSPVKPNKQVRRLIVIVGVIAVVAIIILAVILMSGINLERHQITAYGETLFTTIHTPSGDSTVTIPIVVPADDQYRVGGQIKWDESFHNPNGGVRNITSIVCTTPGFTFAGSSPGLPVTLPNTATKEEGSIMLTLAFDTPSTPYVGPLNYTIFYDLYLSA
jgi:hypothetical protein